MGSLRILQQQKFEILFEIGAHAILDGYYREAVASFTSALEGFYEFAIKVFLEHSSKSENLFQSCWKRVGSQSERQIGAFIFLWASHFKECPSLLADSEVSFRNKVIHRGKIPTKTEAIKYGNAVLDILRPKILAIKNRFSAEMFKIISYHLRDCRLNTDSNRIITTVGIPTIVNLTHSAGSESKPLEEFLIQLAKWKKVVKWQDT